ncbi:hypothetical protein Sru01_67000 [Sphaerisporangium rufum]|uniref:Uncharacterized protein n=1 Tax=Sphaerisporangium rufum TaxID=1381558 RepID=A0A919V4Z4_9ACTN|nr:hypothetical protein [Sphaerisporangium rufum]GII81718.1 hypothetical protein Sru01_67000 [Sphaerisporangium rufum]
MANEVTEGKTAARELSARLPGWMVWYGEHTRRFWAVPRSSMRLGAALAEADTPQELEAAVRRITGGDTGQHPAPDAGRAEQADPRAQQSPHPHPGQHSQHPGQQAPQESRQPVPARY